jgi:hypothetical protein
MKMKRLFVACLILLGALAGAGDASKAAIDPASGGWRSEFKVDAAAWAPTGRNAYFILEPGYRLVLEGGGVRLTITVTDQTRMVDGVETRMVEERETKNGNLAEVSRNYFAMDRNTSDVYYFGEEVDMYKGGKIVGHEGAWLSGEKGAKFGLMIPGKARIGDRYYQESAPGVAMDRARIVSVTETLKTPAGEFKDCLKVEETTPLEPKNTEFKIYAPGIGLIKDGELLLNRHGSI